jgi:hypothetical protein
VARTAFGYALVPLVCIGCAVPPAVAACLPGAQDCPIPVRMARGSDTVTLEGRFRQNVDCCAYSLDARAGQTLAWSFDGPAERATIAYPNGDVDGPGVPASIPLPATGTYVFRVSPNLMADGSFGPFRLTVTIR